MKKCSYCGKEYSDEATECVVDGTALVVDGPRIPEEPKLVGKWLGTLSAIGCLIAAPTAVLVYILFVVFNRWQGLSAANLFGIAISVAGLVLGFVALVNSPRREQPTQFGIAVVGVGLNVLFLLFFTICGALLEEIIVEHDIARARAGQQRKAPAQEFDAAMQKLAAASSDQEKFYALGNASRLAFVAGKFEEARKLATDLLATAPRVEGNSYYGDAILDGNVILGRIALRDGQVDKAKEHLIAAGKSPGSSHLDKFGPNMSLAKELLEKGERDVVLQYFELCRKFWKTDDGKLDEWTRQVKASENPDFSEYLAF
jgi:tetratricopeptide (TPR) repeat protein